MSSLKPARILRGAAAVFGVLCAGLIAWLIDKAIRYPQIRASQFDYTAPLWIPAALFVAVCMGFSIYMFLRAARRAEGGEDLFAQRHRRHPRQNAPDDTTA